MPGKWQKNMGKVIVVEDNPLFCKYICNRIEREGIKTEKASQLSEAKKLVASAGEDDIVLADLRLPDGNGIQLLEWMRREGKNQPFIVMTDYGEVGTAVQSMKLGAEDYIPKKLLEDKLPVVIRDLQHRHEKRKNSTSDIEIMERDSVAFREIMHRVHLIAPTDMSVLILGENGTGKEHIAEKIHLKSLRTGQPFVAVDCGSLSDELAASTFFGHTKGAFTGAHSHKTGYFEEAEGGTLFLDEVGNLSYETQQKLLRAIQQKCYRPIGAKEDRASNVRIIAATNEDLRLAIAEKRFRQDLYFRLQDFVINVPPLRECKEDILSLAEFFMQRSNKKLNKAVNGFDAPARKALLAYPWPGNVRELQQKVQSAVLLAKSDMITIHELELHLRQTPQSFSYALKDEKGEQERIRLALEKVDWNLKETAKLLDISRTTLYKKLKDYNLTRNTKQE